jgi:hypothetical protein
MAEVQRRHATMHNVTIPAVTITPSHFDHIYDLKAPHAVEADDMDIGAPLQPHRPVTTTKAKVYLKNALHLTLQALLIKAKPRRRRRRSYTV